MTMAAASLPEEQQDGKWLAELRGERHTQLDGLLQVLLGNIEAVVVDPAALEDVLMRRALLQSGCEQVVIYNR